MRTNVASISTANVKPTPNIRMMETSAAASAVNDTAISSAAAVTTRPVKVRPNATLSSLSAAVRFDDSQNSRMRDIRNTS